MFSLENHELTEEENDCHNLVITEELSAAYEAVLIDSLFSRQEIPMFSKAYIAVSRSIYDPLDQTRSLAEQSDITLSSLMYGLARADFAANRFGFMKMSNWSEISTRLGLNKERSDAATSFANGDIFLLLFLLKEDLLAAVVFLVNHILGTGKLGRFGKKDCQARRPRHVLSMTMPWAICTALAVLWGVCWMFRPPWVVDHESVPVVPFTESDFTGSNLDTLLMDDTFEMFDFGSVPSANTDMGCIYPGTQVSNLQGLPSWDFGVSAPAESSAVTYPVLSVPQINGKFTNSGFGEAGYMPAQVPPFTTETLNHQDSGLENTRRSDGDAQGPGPIPRCSRSGCNANFSTTARLR